MNRKTLYLAILSLVTGLVWNASLPTYAKAEPVSEAFVALYKARTDTIAVPGMQCGMCEEKISKKLKSLHGVQEVSADAEGKQVIVTYDSRRISQRSIERAIAEAGYDAGSARATAKVKAALPGCCRMQ